MLQGSELVRLARGGGQPLWQADDVASTRLMQAFHQHLLASQQDVAQALYGAQVWLQQATAWELGLVATTRSGSTRPQARATETLC